MGSDLGTTNFLLGILATVSVLEALLFIGIGVAGFMAYRKAMQTRPELAGRQTAPAMVRANAILDDVKAVTTKVREETERVDHAVRTTIDRVDGTTSRVKANVKATVSR